MSGIINPAKCIVEQKPQTRVIRFPRDLLLQTRWIGVDLNTTGHAVVAADRVSGNIMKLGKNLHYRRTFSTQNCTKLYHEKKLWKLGKVKSQEKKEFKAALHKIARQIVRFAESACAGIKFEKLFSYLHMHQGDGGSYEFSFENGSFVTLLHLVEKKALNRGIPVRYVNPLNTSKRCSQCGGFGRRVRKRFECPQCGMVIHADVNAAFNIAATPCTSDKAEFHRVRTTSRLMRKRAREAQVILEDSVPANQDLSCPNEIFTLWNNAPVIPGEI